MSVRISVESLSGCAWNGCPSQRGIRTEHAQQVFWFSSLISKAGNLGGVYSALNKAGALEVRTVEMAQGQKQSRFVAWTFLTPEQQQAWRQERWS